MENSRSAALGTLTIDASQVMSVRERTQVGTDGEEVELGEPCTCTSSGRAACLGCNKALGSSELVPRKARFAYGRLLGDAKKA